MLVGEALLHNKLNKAIDLHAHVSSALYQLLLRYTCAPFCMSMILASLLICLMTIMFQYRKKKTTSH